MDWSASTNIRYGISFIIGYLERLHIGSAWENAQYVFFALLIILSLTVYSFARMVLKRSKKVSLALSALVAISPISLLNINYFMFGQSLALPVLILGFLVLGKVATLKSELLLQIAVLIFFFVAYPAMLFPSLIFFGLILLRGIYRGELKFITILQLFVILLGVVLAVFGFDVSSPISRFAIWITSNLNPQSVNLSSDESIPITIFSQFTSIIGLPLTLGLIPYPFVVQQVFFIIIALNFLTFLVFYQVIKHIRENLRKDEYLIPLLMFSFSWLIVPAFGFLKGNSYLYIKVMIWISPIVALVFWDLVLAKYIVGLKSLKARAIPQGTGIITLLSLTLVSILMLQVSFSYGQMFPKWDSFIQRPMPSDYPEFNKLRISKDASVAINATTAEEALWTAGLLGKKRGTFYSLGVKSQALGEGLTTKCTKSFAQKNFSTMDYLLENSIEQDVDIPSQYAAASKVSSFGDWDLYESSSLIFSLIMNGSGTFPPTIMQTDGSPVPGSNVFRWSSGQICFSIYTAKRENVRLEIPYASGPDFDPQGKWTIQAGNLATETTTIEESLMFTVNVQPGWNLIQVERSGCRLPSIQNRWNRRADDRVLCFAIGKIKAQELPHSEASDR